MDSISRLLISVMVSFYITQSFAGDDYTCNDFISVKEHITKSADVMLIKKDEYRTLGLFLIINLGVTPLKFDVYTSYDDKGEYGPYLHEWWTETWKLDLKYQSEGWKIILPTWIGSIAGPDSEIEINPGESMEIWADLRETDKGFAYRLETIDENSRILISEPYCF